MTDHRKKRFKQLLAPAAAFLESTMAKKMLKSFEPVPITLFGKDHWSLLAYVETCCVEQQPIDKRRIRCHPQRHAIHNVNRNVNRNMGVNSSWKAEYGTRLKGYFDHKDPNLQLAGHDDWDCLSDLEHAGLIEILSEANGFVKMTDLGLEIAGFVRNHKATGGMFANFELPDWRKVS